MKSTPSIIMSKKARTFITQMDWTTVVLLLLGVLKVTHALPVLIPEKDQNFQFQNFWSPQNDPRSISRRSTDEKNRDIKVNRIYSRVLPSSIQLFFCAETAPATTHRHEVILHAV